MLNSSFLSLPLQKTIRKIYCYVGDIDQLRYQMKEQEDKKAGVGVGDVLE